MSIKRIALAAAVLALAGCSPSTASSSTARQSANEKQACQDLVTATAFFTPTDSSVLAGVVVDLGHPAAGYFTPAFTQAWEAVVPASGWPAGKASVDVLQRMCDSVGVTGMIWPPVLQRLGWPAVLRRRPLRPG